MSFVLAIRAEKILTIHCKYRRGRAIMRLICLDYAHIHDIRDVTYADKPKFNKHVTVVEVSEHQSHQLSVAVSANPFVDNLVFSRVKETTPSYNRSLAAADSAKNALNDLIDDFENISWLLEPISVRWSWSLSEDTISLHIHNATLHDAGLYVARVSNTLGDSLFFTRLHVKSRFFCFN